MAERVNGKWFIESEQVHSQNRQGREMSELVEYLTAEVEYLHTQLDKQTSLLAATTKQNADLIETRPPPRRSLIARLVGEPLSFSFVARFGTRASRWVRHGIIGASTGG